jgi:hypothetical protein
MTRIQLGGVLLALASLGGCSDDAAGGNEGEVITTVLLEFGAPGGVPVTFTFDDPDGDGGAPPTVDMITLTSNTTYLLALRFQNRLESPPEEITTEVVDEGDQHQVFLTGTAVNGPATSNPTAPLEHMYSDTDSRDLPIGVLNEILTTTGTGELTVTLRHLPPISGNPAKHDGLAAQVKTGGFATISGQTDVQVTFAVTVP